MPKKYYCDYCRKSFQDTPKAREKHFQGVSHQRQKKYYFDTVIFPSMPTPNSSILWSGLTGEQILHLWIQSNPAIHKRIITDLHKENSIN